MILHVENPKGYKKTFEPIHKFTKVVGFKISTWNSAVFLYARNEQSKNIKKMKFTIALERI